MNRLHSRREFLRATAVAAAWPFAAPAAEPQDVIDIGSRRELFVDDLLISEMRGASLRLHKPEPRDVALVCDSPWEGNTSVYFAFLPDDDGFRAYYRGAHFDETTKRESHPEVACHAQSRDGIAWTKPSLGACEFGGSRENNIVWTGEGSHNFTPFRDANPACRPDARYKALAGGATILEGRKRDCLNALQSADGVHWKKMAQAVITDGAFDSQNLAFWDAERGHYRAYWRIFASGVRAIRTATSKDFLRWENQTDLAFGDAPVEHLYTNAIMPYARAPHLLIGFPTRYQPKTEQVEPVFMTSRNGVLFRRWSEELIPITAPRDRDGNRCNYMAWGVLQLPGRARELSVYATEAYYKGPASRVRRFVFRTDGFVSVHAPERGELVTPPLRFAGSELEINARTAGPGGIGVEIQDVSGRPLPGLSVTDCLPVRGDDIAFRVAWKRGGVKDLAGRPVRLRFVLENADLFAMQFHA